MGRGVPEARRQCYNSPMNSDLSETTTRRTRAKMPFLGRTLDRGPTNICYLGGRGTCLALSFLVSIILDLNNNSCFILPPCPGHTWLKRLFQFSIGNVEVKHTAKYFLSFLSSIVLPNFVKSLMLFRLL